MQARSKSCRCRITSGSAGFSAAISARPGRQALPQFRRRRPGKADDQQPVPSIECVRSSIRPTLFPPARRFFRVPAAADKSSVPPLSRIAFC